MTFVGPSGNIRALLASNVEPSSAKGCVTIEAATWNGHGLDLYVQGVYEEHGPKKVKEVSNGHSTL